MVVRQFAWTNLINLHVVFCMLHDITFCMTQLPAWNQFLHEQVKENGAVVGGPLEKAAAVATAAAGLTVPTHVETTVVAVVRSWTFPSRLEHAWTIRAANVVRKNLHQANVNGLACGHVAANVTLLSLNSRHSSLNRCANLLAMADAAERKVQVSGCFFFASLSFVCY